MSALALSVVSCDRTQLQRTSSLRLCDRQAFSSFGSRPTGVQAFFNALRERNSDRLMR